MKPNLSRRAFVQLLAGAAATALPLRALNAAPWLQLGNASLSLEGQLSYDVFTALMGDTFALSSVEAPGISSVPLRLVDVQSAFLSAENEQFQLVFEAYDAAFKADGLYHIQHATAGATQLFLQPMSGNLCQAHFNLLV